MFIDSHSHLGEAEFESDLESVLGRAREALVERVLVIGDGAVVSKAERVIRLTECHPELDACIGIHPHDARSVSDESIQNLVHLARDGRLAAWGEIGLDFYYEHSPPEVQEKIFSQQLVLAREAALPVVIHSRAAESQTLRILEKYFSNSGLGGVMHCYSGSLLMAQRCLEMGFLISFSGMLTFPKADHVRQVAQVIPLNSLLIETDAPYLAPVPHRGKRNEPAFVVETAKVLAVAKNVSLEVIGKCTRENYQRLVNGSTSRLTIS